MSVTIDHPQQTTDAALAAKDGTIAQLKRELQELRVKLAVSVPSLQHTHLLRVPH